MNEIEIKKERMYLVSTANEIAQNSRSKLSAQQWDILHYLISRIQPEDEPKKMYSFKIKNFCQVCGNVESGFYYKAIKDDISAIASANVWVKKPDGKEEIVQWINKAIIDKKNGTLEISFNETIYPYLFNLKKNFSSFPFEYSMVLTSSAAKVLYKKLISMERMNGDKTMELSYLRQQMGGENYAMYADFKRFVLDKAIKEINHYTDIKVYYEPKKHYGRAVSHLAFTIYRINTNSVEYAAHEENRKLRLDDKYRKAAEEWEEENQRQIESQDEE